MLKNRLPLKFNILCLIIALHILNPGACPVRPCTKVRTLHVRESLLTLPVPEIDLLFTVKHVTQQLFKRLTRPRTCLSVSTTTNQAVAKSFRFLAIGSSNAASFCDRHTKCAPYDKSGYAIFGMNLVLTPALNKLIQILMFC